MRDVVFIVTRNTIHAQDLETGSKLASVTETFSSRLNGTACVGGGLMKTGILVAADRSKPLVRFYKSERIEQSIKRVTLPEAATALAVSFDGVLMAVGSQSGNLHVWDLSTGAFLRTFQNPRFPSAINSLIFGEAAKYLLVLYDHAIIVYLLPDLVALGKQSIQAAMESFQCFERHRGRVTATTLCEEGRLGFVVSGDAEGLCLIWAIETGEVFGEIQFASGISCLVLDRNEKTRLIVGLAGSCDMIDINLKIIIGRYKGVALSPEGFPFFSGASAPPHLLKLDEVGTHLISASAGDVHVWSLETRQLLRSVLGNDSDDHVTSLELIAAHPTLKETAEQTAPLALPRTVVMPNFRALEQLTSSNAKAWHPKMTCRNAMSLLADLRRNREDPFNEAIRSHWQREQTTLVPEKALAVERQRLAEVEERLSRSISLLDSTLQRLCADGATPTVEDASTEKALEDLSDLERKILKGAVAIAMGNNSEPPTLPGKAVVAALEARPSWYLKPSAAWSRNKVARTEAAG